MIRPILISQVGWLGLRQNEYFKIKPASSRLRPS